MKIFKRILAAILGTLMFFSSFLGAYKLFSAKVTDLDSSYLAAFTGESGSYYLQKARPDITFYINSSSRDYASLYTLKDKDGNDVAAAARASADGQFKLIPPENGYQKGQTYQLTLSGGAKFSGDELKDASILTFTIQRDDVESYQYSSSVTQLSQPFERVSDTLVRLSDGSVKTGDVLVSQNADGTYDACKVTGVNADGTAGVEMPALDEIYSSIDLYGEYTWSIDELVANPDIPVEIAQNVRKSSFYNALMLSAYAAEDEDRDAGIDVKIEKGADGKSVTVSIVLTLEPGKNGLFGIAQLRNQNVTISLSDNLRMRVNADIKNFTDWDMSCQLTSDFTWSVSLGLYTDELKGDKDLGQLFDPNKAVSDLAKNTNKIIRQLEKTVRDKVEGDIKLFDWKFPTSIPGLYFSDEVKLFAKLETAAEVTIGSGVRTVCTVGARCSGSGIRPYQNLSTRSQPEKFTISLKGKAEFRCGIKMEIKAVVINEKLANITLDPQCGLYADLYAAVPIITGANITNRRFAYGYFEPGVYFAANVKATVNLLLKKIEISVQLIEKKFPIDALTLGTKEIFMSMDSEQKTLSAHDGKADLPVIERTFYDVSAGQIKVEALADDAVTYYHSDGKTDTKLEVQNGKLVLPADSNGTITVTASYLPDGADTASTLDFTVVASGGILEGKVSAYGTDASANPLKGADIKVYDSTGADEKNSAETDADGKFSMGVPAGTYKLKIAASGYKTLTTTQTVAEDETKYTEHILLIDNGQTGEGSAEGTITDALNGQGVRGVSLRLRENWNSSTGDYYGSFSTTTDDAGHYSITGVPTGYYTVEASLNGYVTGYSNILVMSQNPKTDCDFTITPVLDENEIRIVLSWGEQPYDLDSHLDGSTPDGDQFTVFYMEKAAYYNDSEIVNLDVDDTSSYGPETITILQGIYQTYTYGVHDFSNGGSTDSTALSYSGAVVKVFHGSTQVGEYHVPTGQAGTYWTVFTIDSTGRITPVNTVDYTSPANY